MGKKVNRVIKILMKRDKMTYNEAKDLILQCKSALLSGEEDAIMDYLGLEDDYLKDVLDLR